MSDSLPIDRDELALRYLDQLPYPPYPVQEEAILAWYSSEEGVMVSAPTGTGKTLIAEAACYEALHSGRVIYYTTPLIALCDQKFRELQASAVRWGFAATDVGLVTGNRRVNPEAKVLVVVAEILLNRLLHPHEFGFDDVLGVVMDEFHYFNDFERGIVWEFTLSLLPRSVRLLLLSATIGNLHEFTMWLLRQHQRDLQVVQTAERKVPLLHQWVPDLLLNDFLESIAEGDEESRRTPALVFCFNRDECWSVAEELKGRHLIDDARQAALATQLAKYDWSKGAGPKLKPMLMRGVGVHHAGLLPRYKRIVEDLFQKKLLALCVCTETLAAGINLPARSVVVPSLLKGPPGRQKVIDPSSAHQIFGRAGRPQFDARGYVFALPHEDDVKIARWKEKYDSIPENTKDPTLIQARKALKKKMPTRSPTRQYWNDQQFEKLRTSPPGGLASRGAFPWRFLAYLLQLSPEVDRVRKFARQRLMDAKQIEVEIEFLDRMLLALHAAGVVRLEPEPPKADVRAEGAPAEPSESAASPSTDAAPDAQANSWLAKQLQAAIDRNFEQTTGKKREQVASERPAVQRYSPKFAHPTERLAEFFVFRSFHPLFGIFLLDHLAKADDIELLLVLESVLELPRSLVRQVRVPPPKFLPPGPLALEHVDLEIVARGLLPAGDLYPEFDPTAPPEERKYAPPLAEKLKLLFESEYPGLPGVLVTPVWVAGDLLNFSGDFAKYISGRELARQEGLIFRHLLRLILLIGEFRQLTPAGADPIAWRERLDDLAERFTESCRHVDPESTDQMLAHAKDLDIVATDETALPATSANEPPPPDDEFGLGLEMDE